MKQQSSGKIITVSSVAGTAPFANSGYAHYGAAKAAIAHYTRYLAQDRGPFGITANCIPPALSPRANHGNGLSGQHPKATPNGPSWSRCRGLGTVEDCATVVEFLATNLSDYVTGAVIPTGDGLVRA